MSARARLLIVGGVLASSLGLAQPASGAGETYLVAQCHPQNRAHEALLEDDNAYSARSGCSDSSREFSIQLNNTASADNGRAATALWEVPSAALGIVRVDLEAKLRRDSNHRSRLYMTNSAGGETARVATGDTGATGFEGYSWSGSRQAGFGAILVCEDAGGCPQATEPKTWVRNLKLTVGDYSDPRFTDFSGSLIDGGWLRGSHTLTAQAVDAGSGMRRIGMRVNGTLVDESLGGCRLVKGTTTIATHLRPCGDEQQLDERTIDTDAVPFRNGPNSLSVCGYDFAGNPVCDGRTVMVDNAAPALAFASGRDPDDPELIRAPVSDPHSGVATGRIHYRPVGGAIWQPLATEIESGELRARVNSAGLPAGVYEFMAEATDVAGNVRKTSLRADGRPMTLRFPLRDEVGLNAHLEPSGASRQTVRYGRDAYVAGTLQGASGSPLGGESVTVVEYFGEGALIRERLSRVTTDAEGRWSSKLPAGPSREVTAYFQGNRRYLEDRASAGELRVRSKASFKTSRKQLPEGARIRFKGRVRHFGARIPTGGKLIELQVRERAGRWQTVREAFYTKPSGRYRLGYRFGRFYQADAVFKFRLKVVREQGWPYKAPVRSRIRRVVLHAR